MKHFIYFENEDGGMTTYDVELPEELGFLYGWMSEMCEVEDCDLVEWMSRAEVGEYRDHRLGVLVRMKDRF